MIQKWYEATCDNCGNVINHYIGRRPYDFELINDGAILRNKKLFCCEECYHKYERKQLACISTCLC